MVHFYKPELLFVLRGNDPEMEIKKLSINTRRALLKAGLLNSRYTEITKKTLDYLRVQNDEIKLDLPINKGTD